MSCHLNNSCNRHKPCDEFLHYKSYIPSVTNQYLIANLYKSDDQNSIYHHQQIKTDIKLHRLRFSNMTANSKFLFSFLITYRYSVEMSHHYNKAVESCTTLSIVFNIEFISINTNIGIVFFDRYPLSMHRVCLSEARGSIFAS